jgi:hypothetical protein
MHVCMCILSRASLVKFTVTVSASDGKDIKYTVTVSASDGKDVHTALYMREENVFMYMYIPYICVYFFRHTHIT